MTCPRSGSPTCSCWEPHFDCLSGFGDAEVACWPLIPKFVGSNPAEAVGFLKGDKNSQHTK